MNINIKLIQNGKLPEYKTDGSAGADCFARLDQKVIIKPKTVEVIPLGFAVEIPSNYEMQIRGRSGLARHNCVEVFNSPATIDSDYRGEVCAFLFNNSDDEFIVYPNDRIAQAIIVPIIKAEWNLVDKLTETKRGKNGFGSTGVWKLKDKLIKQFTSEEKAEYNHNRYIKERKDRLEYQKHKLEIQNKANKRYRIKCGLEIKNADVWS